MCDHMYTDYAVFLHLYNVQPFWHGGALASYPAFMVRGGATAERIPGFSCLSSRKVSTNAGSRVILVFFRVMATCSDSDKEFLSALSYA